MPLKVLSAKVENLGSYKSLQFDFQNQGLCLISGLTGSGKSTLMDVVCWTLFGRTSKDGAVDDVRTWGVEGDTVGAVTVKYSDYITVEIVRKRGAKNDLFINQLQPAAVLQVRGKDLNDTQKQINELLGLDADRYIMAAYFHEFSQAAQFFTTTAKNRRLVTEQLADLSLAKTVAENLTPYKKELKAEIDKLHVVILQLKTELKNAEASGAREFQGHRSWELGQKVKIERLMALEAGFQQEQDGAINKLIERQELESIELSDSIANASQELLSDDYLLEWAVSIEARKLALKEGSCEHCGAKKDTNKRLVLINDDNKLSQARTRNENNKRNIQFLEERLLKSETSFRRRVEDERAKSNPYTGELEAAKLEENPYHPPSFTGRLIQARSAVAAAEAVFDDYRAEYTDLELLQDVIGAFRVTLVTNVIKQLETNTNQLLSKHFDAELRVKFEITDADKLDVIVFKDGHQAVYSQLSKGQRQLLKLTFGVSVMKAASNASGVSHNVLFLDEVFDGMDENMKAKGFRLLEELSLSHESVFAIDHSESVKSMFNNRYDVEVINGQSAIAKN